MLALQRKPGAITCPPVQAPRMAPFLADRWLGQTLEGAGTRLPWMSAGTGRQPRWISSATRYSPLQSSLGKAYHHGIWSTAGSRKGQLECHPKLMSSYNAGFITSSASFTTFFHCPPFCLPFTPNIKPYVGWRTLPLLTAERKNARQTFLMLLNVTA